MPALTRPLAEAVLPFRIDEEMFALRGSAALARSGRSARTLVKDGPLRVTLIVLCAGGRIAAHRAAGPITIQAVSGTVVVEAEGRRSTLFEGDAIALRADVEHAVDSAVGGAFLLTVVSLNHAAIGRPQ